MSRTITLRYSSAFFILLLTVSVFSSSVFADGARSDAVVTNLTKISEISEGTTQQYATFPSIPPASAQFGGSAFGYSSFNTSNVSSNIYTENSLICSNEPSGKYCEDWEASCKQTSGTYMDDRFWTYYRIKDSVHNNKVDVTHYSDAKDPNGNDICWNSGCEDRVRADIKFDCPNCPWICTWWTFTLGGPPGKWNVFFDIKDNIDKSSAKLDTYPEIWCKSNSDCSGSSLCQNKQCVKCGAKSESAWVNQNSNTCDGNLVTSHKFSNTGGSDLTYDIYFYVYGPDGSQITSVEKLNQNLQKDYEVTWEMTTYPPSGGWEKKGTYRVKAKLVGKCNTNVNVENNAYPEVLKAPCINCKAVSRSTNVVQENLCRESLITEHAFENQGGVKIPYDVKFYLYNSQGALVESTSNSGQLQKGYYTTWNVRWTAPSGGWKSGTYESRAELVGKCPDGDVIIKNYAYPKIPSSCDTPVNKCNGIIYADALDSGGKGIQGIKAYLDGNYHGDTNSGGRRTMNTVDNSCGTSHAVSTYCSDGRLCGSQSTVIEWNNDDDSLQFNCDMCVARSQLGISVSGSSKFVKNDKISLEVSVSAGSAIGNALVKIYDPFTGKYMSGTTGSNGKFSYSSDALKVGTYTYTISATKDGYTSGSTSFTVTVTDFNGKIFVSVDSNGNPVKDAKIYLDSKFDGLTGPDGKKTVIAGKGGHTLDVYCPSGNFCGSKSVTVNAVENVKFGCNCILDSDGDGITDEDENLIGSDPLDKNSNLTSLMSDRKLQGCFNPFSIFSMKLGEEERSKLINTLNNSAYFNSAAILQNFKNDSRPVAFQEAFKVSDRAEALQAGNDVVIVLTDDDTETTSIFLPGAYCSGVLVGLLYGAGHGIKDDVSFAVSVFKGLVYYAQNARALGEIPGKLGEFWDSIGLLFSNYESILHQLSLDIFKEAASVNYVKNVPDSDKKDYAAFNVGFYHGFVTGYVGEQILLGKGVTSALKSFKSVGKISELIGKVSEITEKLLKSLTRITEKFGSAVADSLGKLAKSKKGMINFGKWSEDAQDGLARLTKVLDGNTDEVGKIIEGMSEEAIQNMGKNVDNAFKELLKTTNEGTLKKTFGKMTKTKIGNNILRAGSKSNIENLARIINNYESGSDVLKWLEDSANVKGIENVIDNLGGAIKGGGTGAKGYEYELKVASYVKGWSYKVEELSRPVAGGEIDIIFGDSSGKIIAAEIKSGSVDMNQVSDQVDRLIKFVKDGNAKEAYLISQNKIPNNVVDLLNQKGVKFWEGKI